MNRCGHSECGWEEQVWLSSTGIGYGEIKKHSWCKKCGIIKNISDDRPKKIGYWMNILSIISDKFSLTQCQKRLISKEIESCECFHDLFGTFGSDQKEMFTNIISKATNIRLIEIESIIS